MRSGRMYGLFEVFGLELEYMVVDRDSLKVKSIVDELIRKKVGVITSDVDNGVISWSNELTSHVIEIKTTVPSPRIQGLSKAFHQNILEINELLKSENAILLPSAAHPFMDPFTETKLWEHEYNEVYEVYNRIFDCRGHGWSNLQSFHINLPFQHDIDFERLHAAVRVLLPLIPVLSASSPILDGKFTGYIDGRMEAYSHHQDKMPCLMGKLIPEQVFTEVDYHKVIYEPIMAAIAPFDTNKVMDHHFLNSRGAIARFDRGAIEIRVIDVQECPKADMAICAIITEALRDLVNEKHCSLKEQKKWHEDRLRVKFDKVIKYGSDALIVDQSYLNLFGISESKLTASACWKAILNNCRYELDNEFIQPIEHILNNGNLSERILKHTTKTPTMDSLLRVCRALADCLQENRQL